MRKSSLYTTYPDKIERDEVALIWSDDLITAKVIDLPDGMKIAFGFWGLLSLDHAKHVAPDLITNCKQALGDAQTKIANGEDIEEWCAYVNEASIYEGLARSLRMAIQVAEAWPEKADVPIWA